MQSHVSISAAGRTHTVRSTSLALLVLASLTAVGKAQRFDQFTVSATTTAFPVAHVVTDPVTGAATLVAFNNTGPTDTFTWNGTAFVPAGIPSPAGSAGDAMGATASGFVYFDSLGRTSTRPSGGAWSAAAVLTPSPSSRGLAAMTNRVTSSGSAFLFGGATITGASNELWEFNGTGWINRTPTSGPQPAPRSGATLVSDGLGSLILFGGSSATNTVLNDVWRFNGSQWSLLNKAPFKRTFHAMMLDVVRNNFLVLGGQDSTGLATDAWTVAINGATVTWTQVATGIPTASPAGITWGAMDGIRNQAVLIDLSSDVTLDALASALVFGTNVPTPSCRAPNLGIIGFPPVTQPRIGATVPLGGIVGVAGAPMFMLAAVVTPAPGIAVAPTPIPGSTCVSWLPASASNIATMISSPAGTYSMNFPIPNNPVFIGTVVDFEAFGVTGAQIIASDALRMAIG